MKSSFSNPQGQCINVESIDVGTGPKVTIVETDEQLHSGQFNGLFTTPENFQAFIDGVKAGEFDYFGTA